MKNKKSRIRIIVLLLFSCMLLSVSGAVIYAYVTLDEVTREELTVYLLHKRAIDRRCQEVFCERLQPGMDVEIVKTIILEEYDVEFTLTENWTGLEGDQFMLMKSERPGYSNIILFGKYLALLFNEGHYVLTYVFEFDSGYLLCEENGK